MTPEAIAERAIHIARELATDFEDKRVSAGFAIVEFLVRKAVVQAVREVDITAPGVAIEDKRVHGGAVLSDLRSIQSKSMGDDAVVRGSATGKSTP